MEIEIVADMQESREIEDRRETLQAEFITQEQVGRPMPINIATKRRGIPARAVCYGTGEAPGEPRGRRKPRRIVTLKRLCDGQFPAQG